MTIAAAAPATALFEGLSPSHVSDALKKANVGGGVIHGLEAVGADERLLGVAVTVQCMHEPHRSVDPAEYRTEEIEAALNPGSVLVLDADGTDLAITGPVAALAYASRGARGIIANGGARDIPGLRASGLPVLARRRVTLSGFGRTRRELVPRVVIDGIEIRLGDILVGDEGGLVVCPADGASAVAKIAREIGDSDQRMIAGVKAGTPFDQLWAGSPRSSAAAQAK